MDAEIEQHRAHSEPMQSEGTIKGKLLINNRKFSETKTMLNSYAIPSGKLK